ncbi:MAG: hypothetical protein ACI9UN_003660 [Granulosicoccus sp.]|jgi:hypothetical protein
MNKVLAGLVLLVGSTQALAGGLDIALSNDTANISLTLSQDPLLRQNSRYRDGGAELALGGFVSEAGDGVVHLTFMARGIQQSMTSQYNISAGVKILAGEIEVGTPVVGVTESESVGALALGFQAGLVIPSNYNPVELSFEGFYAPSITSFSDAERYGELTARLQIEIMPRARAYIGYRRMLFDTNDADNVRLDHNAHFGLSISF